MKVLITGATGWIGSHVARELVLGDHDVHAILRPGSDPKRLRSLEGRIRLWEGPLDHVPIDPDLLIHLAWYAVPGKYLEAPENVECLEASRRLLKKVSCRAVVAGTCFEQDTRVGVLSEGSPTRPTSLYARSKDVLRQEVETRPNSAWTRFFYQYGPSEDPARLVPKIIRGVLSGEPVKLTPGDQRRDFLHVEDVARAVIKVGESKIEGSVQIGSGVAYTQKRIARKLAGMSGRLDLLQFGAVSYFEGEPMLIQADNRKLLSTGWTPLFNIELGLEDTFHWWQNEYGCAR